MTSRRTFLRSAAAAASATVLAPRRGSAQTPKYNVKLAHPESTTQPRHLGLEKVVALIKERTNGDVVFTIYPLTQLGTQRQQVEGTQFGAIECSVLPSANMGGFNPLVSILDIPYIYPTDRAQAQKLRDGPFGQTLLKSFASRGVHAQTLWPNGRKNLTSNKPLTGVESLRGQRFRVIDSKVLIEQFAAVGATAIPINFNELYTSLQTGLIDGQENPLDTITTMKFHEVQKNLYVTEHGALEDVVLFNGAWWRGLPPAYQQAIGRSFDELRPEVERMKEAAQKAALEIITAAKLTVKIADEAERQRLREAMAPRARAAFIERAGQEGQKLLEVYDAEMKKIS